MAKITKKIAEIKGNGAEFDKQREQFSFLQKMAEAKCAEFSSQLKEMLSEGGREKCEIVGNRAIAYHASQHVDISMECDAAIMEAVDSFFEGKSGVKEGFQKLIKCALSTLLGNMAIGEDKENMFFIYPENYTIVRVDVMMYKYTFSSHGLVANCENIFCYTMSKSIVDHKKLTKDELMYFVTQMCRGGKGEEVSLNEIMAFVKELITVWNVLDAETKNNADNAKLVNGIVLPHMDQAQIDKCNSAAGALKLSDLEDYMAKH